MLMLARIIRFALATFWRNIWLSVATTLVMFLTLFMVTTLVMLNVLADSALTVVQDKVDLSVYLVSDVTDEEVAVVQSSLESLSEVQELSFTSREEALAEFTESKKDDPVIRGALEEFDDNPLQPSFTVKAATPADYKTIIDRVSQKQFNGVIENVNFADNETVIEKLTSTTNLLSNLAIWVTLLFTIIAVLIIFNTIRLAIYTQRDEISVMRLVGAQSMFIRLPLVLVGAMYGVLAAVVSTLVLIPVVQYVGPRASAFLGEASLNLNTYFFANIWLIFGAQLAFGVLLGVLSSIIAIRRYLRKSGIV